MRSDHNPRLVVLGRDGTLNVERDDHVKSADEWQPLPGALEAVARLNHGGWHVAVATNQSGLGRGLFDMAAFNAIHAKMNTQLTRLGGRIDAVFFCPHTDDEECDCRKPAPGLIELVAQRYGVAATQVPVLGNSLDDLQAAAAAGAQPHLVRTGHAARLDAAQVAELAARVPGTTVHADLAAFADHLLQREHAARGQASAADVDDSGFGLLK